MLFQGNDPNGSAIPSGGDILVFQNVFVGEQLTIAWNGSIGNPITFQQWPGKPKWEINVNNAQDFGVRINASYIVLNDVEIYGANVDGVRVAKDGGVTNFVFNNNWNLLPRC